MRLKPLIILVLAAFLLFGCAAKISKSSIRSDFESTDLKKALTEIRSENFWVQCFNVSENEINENMSLIMKQCIEKEFSSAPDFLTASEVEVIKNNAMFCIQMKMWSVYKDRFSLDKNLNNIKMFSFCQEVRDAYQQFE